MTSASTELTTTAGDRDRIAYLDTGDRSPTAVVLLHSLGADHRMWRPLVDHLSPAHRVLAPDSRAHGRSDIGGPPSADAWAADVDRVLDHAGVDSAVLVGLSLGGIQAITYAAAHPERVAALVVADSFVELGPEIADAKTRALADQAYAQGMSAVADSYIDDTFIVPPVPAGAEDVRSAIAGMTADAYAAAVAACFGVRIADRLPAITAPTLVVWGDHDQKTPRALSERIAGEIPGARLEEVSAAGHLSVVDNPTGFIDVVAPFVVDHLSARPRRAAAQQEGTR